MSSDALNPRQFDKVYLGDRTPREWQRKAYGFVLNGGHYGHHYLPVRSVSTQPLDEEVVASRLGDVN